MARSVGQYLQRSLVAAAALLVTSSAAWADYPNRTIHIVVPFAAGGGTDSIARGFAEALRELVDVSVVVDNISGASGMTGNIRVARSAADGYTLLLNGSTDITATLTFRPEVPFSLDDIAYIGGFFDSPTWLLSHEERGYADLQDFLDRAEAEPGQLTIGTAGPTQLLMATAIRGITGLDIRIVPFDGGADLRPAMIGNQVDIGIFHAPVMLAEVREGLIDIVGTGRSLDRITYEPARGTQTLEDVDISMQVGITRGIYVHKDTPDDVVATLSDLVQKAAESDTFAAFAEKFGFAPVWVPGPDFEEQVRGELALFQEIKAKYLDDQEEEDAEAGN